ncbi:MAG: hypothetical protein DHS20C14_20930 [Phycisphaeraceae bacterium]|nr:MAG: hypothetical protein DHS20C14_20930 [Phycisphaeraceae bacterium]
MSETNEGEAPVVVAEYETELQAGFARSLLEEHGIEARMVGGLTAGFRAEAPGRVRVLVHAADLERARAILSEEE